MLGAVAVAVGVGVGWSTRTTSGDPGGRILAQIVPAASALPGYGTSALPLRSSTLAPTEPYLIESEPHQTSCDGRPGTAGWSSVVVQARVFSAGTRAALVNEVGARLRALGWTRLPDVRSTDTEHMWKKTLTSGATAHAVLTSAGGRNGPWTFVVTAPPISHAASGC